MSPSFKRILGASMLGAVALLAFLGLTRSILEFLFILPLGWVGFLQRVVPQITWNGSVIGMSMLCLAVMLVGGQTLMNGFWKNWARTHSGIDPRPWPWRSTASIFALIFLPFLSGMAVTGTVHQLAWVSQAKEPLFVNLARKQSSFNDMRILAGALDQALLEAESRPDGKREPIHSYMKGNIAGFKVVLLKGREGGRADSYFLIPLDPDLRKFGVTTRDQGDPQQLTDQDLASRIRLHPGGAEILYFF